MTRSRRPVSKTFPGVKINGSRKVVRRKNKGKRQRRKECPPIKRIKEERKEREGNGRVSKESILTVICHL